MDPYSLCPCGSGKKLKFCCSDLIHEIERIHRMIEGDQPRAALRHVEQTLVKQPGRSSLLDLQAMLQMSLGEPDAAMETIAEFLRRDPRSPSAHAHHAIALADRGQVLEAVDALQSALDLVETNMPQRVVEAIGAVGLALFQSMDAVASRAHLWLYEMIMGEHDTRAIDLLAKMNRIEMLPLLLRDQRWLRSLPEGHPVAAEMAAIKRLSAVGKWRSAAAKLDELLPDYLDEPIFFYNRALLSGYLGDKKNFAAGMRLYARQEIPLADAVEAEALAQLVDEASQEPRVEAVKATYDVSDSDRLVERFTSDKRVFVAPAALLDQFATNGPKPRAMYFLLDRPALVDWEHLAHDQVPHMLGEILHYGRQTDRAERIELLTDRGHRYDETLQLLSTLAGDAIGPQADEQVEGTSLASDPALDWRWHFPPGTPQEKRIELEAEATRAALLERWPASPRRTLGGRTPREAAQEPELQLPLLALILLLEQGEGNAGSKDVFDELRAQLGLPAIEPIETGTWDVLTLPLNRVPRADLSSISTDDLARLYQRAMFASATHATEQIIREALGRPDFANHVPIPMLYRQLFTFQDSAAGAREVLSNAREWAASQGESCGQWDLLELQLQIAERRPEEANRLLSHLLQEHMEESEIAEQVYELLHMLGAIPNAGAGQEYPVEEPVPAAARSDSSIWTPDSERGEGSTSKLWTPD